MISFKVASLGEKKRVFQVEKTAPCIKIRILNMIKPSRCLSIEINDVNPKAPW